MPELAIFLAVVFAVNLMPAFGPPTWTIVALYALRGEIGIGVLVVAGALAAAAGRLALAHATRHLGARVLSDRARANLAAARTALERRRRNTAIGLGVFALSPIPSAQLFEAAGLAGLRLLPFTAAFFAGRLVSYAIYAASAKGIAATSVGAAFRRELASPLGIAVQIALLVAVVLLTRIDWARLLDRHSPAHKDADPPAG